MTKGDLRELGGANEGNEKENENNPKLFNFFLFLTNISCVIHGTLGGTKVRLRCAITQDKV